MLDDESTALATALFLHRTIDDPTIPVVVRTRGDAGLGASVRMDDEEGDPRFPGLRLFPLLDRTCSPALMDGGVREELARALYEDHLNRAAARGVVDPAWSALTDDEREAAREAADGLSDALEENGFELLPLRHWGAPTVAFTPDETRRMAERDHNRWRARRGSDGWRYGNVRDAREKVTPQLVPWDELAPRVAGVQPHPDPGDADDPGPQRLRARPALTADIALPGHGGAGRLAACSTAP